MQQRFSYVMDLKDLKANAMTLFNTNSKARRRVDARRCSARGLWEVDRGRRENGTRNGRGKEDERRQRKTKGEWSKVDKGSREEDEPVNGGGRHDARDGYGKLD